MKQDNWTQYTIENLIARINAGDQPAYLFFWGHQHDVAQPIGKSCLSQWFQSSFVIDGITYATAEHYMMAAKAQLFNDSATLEKIRRSTDPAEVKKLGRQISGHSDHVWQAHRFDIVTRANLAKFSQNENLGTFLLNTNDLILVEASPVDAIWGVGMAHDHPDIGCPKKWQGLNLLGFALMSVRDKLGKL